MKKLQQISGTFILMSFLAGLTSFFGIQTLYSISGIVAWVAGLLLFMTIPRTQWGLTLVLLSAGLGCFSVAFFYGFNIPYTKAFSINQVLLMLLISVNYLKIVAMPEKEEANLLPVGTKSFFSTYIGVHLFGSIINLSAIFLVLDRLMKQGELKRVHLGALTRAFSSDALWSPFFVAFAAAMVYAPEAEIYGIWKIGIPLVGVALFITWWEFKGKPLENFVGYPIRPSTLLVPFVLALCVLVAHQILPDVKMIVLVSLFSFVLTMVLLSFRQGMQRSLQTIQHYTLHEVPKMRMELVLFLVAGFFGVGVSTLLDGFSIALPFETFTVTVAIVVLALMVLLSYVGIHPVITISVLGHWLQSIEVDHTLMAVMFLCSWSISVCSSPVSGLNLAIAGRYNVKAREMFMMNVGYSLKLYIVAAGMMYLLF